MEALRLILVFIHLIGLSLLLGGAISQYLTGKLRINSAMLWGAFIQVLSGIALSAPLRDGHEPPPAKLVTKLVIALLILVMVYFSRKREEVNRGHFLAIIGMTLLNTAVAVFWR